MQLNLQQLIGANVSLAQGYKKLEKENDEWRQAVSKVIKNKKTNWKAFVEYAKTKHVAH